MIASTVACTLIRLAVCERDLLACTAVTPSGSWAAALRYIDLARQMLEPVEVSAVRSGLLSGNVAQHSLDKIGLSTRAPCNPGIDGSGELLGLPSPGQ